MEEYIGMTKMFIGDYAPINYLLCNGDTLPISKYNALFAVIGTTYGGDGKTSFKLPDFRGRITVGMGSGPGLTPRPLGQYAGVETVTLNTNQVPPHNHVYNALSGSREAPTPAGNFLGTAAGNFYSQQDSGDQLLPMNEGAISPAGGGQAHDNMPPFLCINFIICVFGIFPSRQ
ncbi:phage tail protein [Emticicia fontis]